MYSGVPQKAKLGVSDEVTAIDGHSLFVFSDSDMFSLHRPKSQRAIWPV